MTVKASLRIMRRELGFYFVSPIAYIVIVVFLIATGWFFFSVFFLNGRADLRDFFSLLPLILTFVVPAVTMRLFSEEFSSGSYEILLTLPVSRIDILAGKFLAALSFALLMLIPTLSYPIFVSTLGELDWGPVAGGYLGAIFLIGLLCAVGLFASSLTKNQIVAFIVGVAMCFFLTQVHRVLFLIPVFLTGFFQFLGASTHFNNIAKGVLDSRDLLYFVSLSFIALYFTNIVIEYKR
ncbi:MAG: ABC transporter permease subunit [Spirochaetia bacterium]|jgi:ABC-2 type transport system permease protein